MRFGNWRGATLAAGVVPALMLAFNLASTPARAQDFHTIPRLVPAIDLNTGGPYNAPPVPFGHYAKGLDYYTGKVSRPIHGLLGKLHGAGTGCGLCGGKGCGACGGNGGCGDGGCGHGNGCGIGGPCAGIGGGGGCGLLGKLKGLGGCGLCGGKGCGSCIGHASTAVTACAQSLPSPQVVPSAQCGDSGCGLLGKHRHKGCGLCGGLGHKGGRACGGCAVSDPCGGCGGRGCGLCGNGLGSGCGACGGQGCGLCGGAGKHLAGLHGMVGHLLGRDKIRWFVGPGGPVPLTPGYVPYVNVTRSPRDFFAFPPMTP